MKTDYNENNTMEKNLKVAVKILLKTMDATTPSPERIEVSILSHQDGALVHRFVSEAEVSALIAEIQKEVEAEQKKAESTAADI